MDQNTNSAEFDNARFAGSDDPELAMHSSVDTLEYSVDQMGEGFLEPEAGDPEHLLLTDEDSSAEQAELVAIDDSEADIAVDFDEYEEELEADFDEYEEELEADFDDAEEVHFDESEEVDEQEHPEQTEALTPSRLLAVVNWVRQRLTGPPASIVMIQVFLALGWSRAVVEKVIDPEWWTNDVVRSFILNADQPIGWYQPFAQSVLMPAALFVSAFTLTLQIGAALSMFSGRHLNYGLGAGMFLTTNFLAMGAINPAVFYLVLQGTIALWLLENQHVPTTLTRLRASAAFGLFLAVISAPSINTLHPYHVLEDVGIMMTTVGLLLALGCELTSRRLYNAGLLYKIFAKSSHPGAQCETNSGDAF